MNARSLLPSLIILSVSTFFFINTWSIVETSVTTVSSAMFPRLILGVIMAMTAINLWGEVHALKRGDAKVSKPVGPGLLVVLGLLALLLVLMKLGGFVIAATSFMTIFSLYISAQWKDIKAVAKTVAFNLLLSLGIYYLFVEVLLFALP